MGTSTADEQSTEYQRHPDLSDEEPDQERDTCIHACLLSADPEKRGARRK